MFSSLISCSQLAEHLDHPDWVIIDCRFDLKDTGAGRNAWITSHIPGSRYAHLDEDLSGKIIPGKTGRHPLPDPEVLAARFSDWGIDEAVQVIAYDNKGGGIASRLWWMCRWLGHQAVAVLDGGWNAWIEGGFEVETEAPQWESKTFISRLNTSLLASISEVEHMSKNGKSLLIDSRAAARYRGEIEPIDPVAGHIPSAISAPFAENLNSEKYFLSTEELGQRFMTLLGPVSADETVFYCGSGVTACHNLLAMHHAGISGGRLYPGSWSEWITDPNRPTAPSA